MSPNPVEQEVVQNPVTIVGLSVDGYKRLRAARLRPTKTGLVRVRGRNAQGKSSLLQAIQAGLEGRAAAEEEPIQRGAHASRVLMDLGEIVVRKEWSRDAGGKAKAAISITAAGTKVRSPQAVLDALRGHLADPVRLMTMDAKARGAEVLRVLGIDDELRALEREHDARFEERRDLGRDADRTRKAMEAMAADLPLMLPDEDEGQDSITFDALTGQLDEARRANAAVSDRRTRLRAAEIAGRAAAGRVSGLEARLAELDAERERVLAALEKASADVASCRVEWTTAKAAVETAQEVDEAPILAQMRALEAGREDRAKVAAYRRAEAAAEEAGNLHFEADQKVEDVRGRINALLAGAKFPIDGLSIDPETRDLLVNGIPFDQASHSEKIRVAAAIAMSGNPKIRVMFVRDGSMMDEDSLAQLESMAEAAGWQVWVELVDSKREGVGVWIEDGEAYEDGEIGNGESVEALHPAHSSMRSTFAADLSESDIVEPGG